MLSRACWKAISKNKKTKKKSGPFFLEPEHVFSLGDGKKTPTF